jgi:heat shock protein HslJ
MRRSLFGVLVVGLVVSACAGSGTDPTTTQPANDTAAFVETSTPVTTSTTEPTSAVEAPELADTSWNVVAYQLPSGSITNVWKTDVTIAFVPDGTVSGSAGCNPYEGIWSVSGNWNEFESGASDSNDGQALILDSLSWTEMACEDDAVMEQEAEILDLLHNAGNWVLIRGEFNLRDAEGHFLFKAEPV